MRKTRRNRTHRGGVKLRDLVFNYTTNPARIAWVKATYNMGPVFLRMIDTIPWSSYQYKGPTQLGFLNNDTGEIESIEERNVTATCFQIPYFVFGGASCEVFNLHYTEPGTPRLHETTDPTGDIDCTVEPLVVTPELTNQDTRRLKMFLRNEAGEVINTITNTELMFYPIKHGGGYSRMYDDYTRWVFQQICTKLESLQDQVSGPLFVQKQTQGDPETESADLNRHIGKFLVTRSIVDSLVKIQIGVGVKYGESVVYDHCVELLLDAPEDVSALTDMKELKSKMSNTLRIERVSADLPFGVFVRNVFLSISDQAEAYASRAEDAITQSNNNEAALRNYQNQLGYKYLNHYGRLVYLLKLLKYLNENVYKKQIGMGSFYSITKKILGSKKIQTAAIPMCWSTCDFAMIQRLMKEITDYRPQRAPVAAGTGASRKTRKRRLLMNGSK